MAAPAVAVIEDEIEEYFSADEAGHGSPPPRDFHTPLPPDVMEELAQITNKLVKFKEKRNPEVEDALQLFIQEWRSQTEHEIDELKKLKDHVAIRKSQRAEEDARLAEMRREEEEMKIRMAEEDRIRKYEEKMKRLADAELKRQKMMEEQSKGRNFKIASTVKEEKVDQDTTRELTKEELEARKSAALSVIIKPLILDGLQKERLKKKANELWEQLVKLETDRYDLEEKRTRQDYDYKELKERQKQQLRQKALKLGLDPEALTGRYPPKIRVASKYERRKELRPFGETKDLFEGGFIKEGNRKIDDAWHKRQDIFTKRNPEELPPWLADMPRQTIKQIEEEEAIKAVITKEEIEGKQRAADEEAENENVVAEEEQDAEAEEVDEEEDGLEKKEIVITDGSEAASEVQEEEEEEEEELAEDEEEVESVAATEEQLDEVASQHTAEEEYEEEEEEED